MIKLATTMYTASKTNIPGLLIFDIDYPKDERGYYQENFQKEKLVTAGLPKDFQIVQINVSYNIQPGVTRGIHAEPWNKYLSIVTGKIFLAFVDLRAGDGFGQVFTTTLDKNRSVFLPKGVASSFQTLEADTYYLYSVDAHWSTEAYENYCFLNLADPTINIKWPISLDKAIVNDRDRNHPMLKDVKPMEI